MTKAIAAFFGALAVAYVALRPSPSRGPLPADVSGLAARIAAHPADWLAASALTERALDARVSDRKALWQASSAVAAEQARFRPEPRAALARSAFFHWDELNAAERKAVLDAYAPVLSDPTVFKTMFHSLYGLTGDLDYLRRAQPHRLDTSRLLAWLAATYGRFDDYRAIRAEIEKQYEENAAMPEIHPIDAGTIDAARGVLVTAAPVLADDVPPYVEVYVDGRRQAEGVLTGEQTFDAPVEAEGTHRIEVRIANPYTRNWTPRRIRIVTVRAR